MSTEELNIEESEAIQNADIEKFADSKDREDKRSDNEAESVTSVSLTENASDDINAESVPLKKDGDSTEKTDDSSGKKLLPEEGKQAKQEEDVHQMEAEDSAEHEESKHSQETQLSDEEITEEEDDIENEYEEVSTSSKSFGLLGSDNQLTHFPIIEEKKKEKKVSRVHSSKSTKIKSSISKSGDILQVEKSMSEACRQDYYQLCAKLEEQYTEEKAKNTYLTKQFILNCQKRKMFYMFQEEKVHAEVIKEYENQLDHLQSITESAAVEEEQINSEIAKLKETIAAKRREVEVAFMQLQNLEYEVGKQLVVSDNKNVEEKVLDRLLKRQQVQLNNLRKIRTDYIKMRNKVNEIQETLDNIDNLSSNFRLMDYEQLKLDNRNLHDKLEERYFEIRRVRLRCQNTMQILAHFREKTASFDSNIRHLRKRYDSIMYECAEVREQVNTVKHSRDVFRGYTEKLQESCGLLGKPRFLKDMRAAIDEIACLTKTLEEIKKEYFATTQKIRNIRKNMSPLKLEVIQQRMIIEAHRKKSTATSLIDITLDS